MCCLKYEQDCYETMQRKMPAVGSECTTPDGIGIVLENNVISETTRVKVTLSDGTYDIKTYPFVNLKYKTKNKEDEQASAKEDEPDDGDIITE